MLEETLSGALASIAGAESGAGKSAAESKTATPSMELIEAADITLMDGNNVDDDASGMSGPSSSMITTSDGE